MTCLLFPLRCEDVKISLGFQKLPGHSHRKSVPKLTVNILLKDTVAIKGLKSSLLGASTALLLPEKLFSNITDYQKLTCLELC